MRKTSIIFYAASAKLITIIAKFVNLIMLNYDNCYEFI